MSNNLMLLGSGTSGTGTLTPPTVAPVLTVSADVGSYTAALAWTASNKTGSAGFEYVAYYSTDEITYNEFDRDTDLEANFSIALGSEGLYYFKVIPINDAGEGPSSNTASVVLPGESNPQALLLEDGTAALLEDSTELLLEAA
jgi:hypothetical protein